MLKIQILVSLVEMNKNIYFHLPNFYFTVNKNYLKY